MSIKQMSFKKIVAVLALLIIIVGGLSLFLMDREIARPPSWPPTVKRYANFFVGSIRVVDTETGQTLFYTGDDQEFNPVQFEKLDDTHWHVTFEKRKP